MRTTILQAFANLTTYIVNVSMKTVFYNEVYTSKCKLCKSNDVMKTLRKIEIKDFLTHSVDQIDKKPEMQVIFSISKPIQDCALSSFINYTYTCLYDELSAWQMQARTSQRAHISHSLFI
ncbi:hypothetical protein D917_07543 [Trichinella nativa]|uniref:Uncharacterized protein n=1 Tax=Trichinella nativa TaxID=6335 RepID=A0A1Y3ENF4_9BILA|nr:hypothetical protein D917_07543 [Trichinella nativa]